jgi:cytochrome b561
MASTRLTNYSIAQRVMHWLTFLLVFFNLILPGSIEHVADTFDDGGVPGAIDMFSANLHIYSGVAILVLTLLRLLFRFFQGAPTQPAGEPDIFHTVGKISHVIFYAVLLAMPALGIAKYFFGIDAAGDLHGGPVKLLLWALIGLHVAAVLVHQFYWKTNVLARMTKGSA